METGVVAACFVPSELWSDGSQAGMCDFAQAARNSGRISSRRPVQDPGQKALAGDFFPVVLREAKAHARAKIVTR